MADHCDVEVTHQGLILAAFEVREAQFAFLVLQGAFDRPACEGDVQPGFELVMEWVEDQEPLLLLWMHRVVSPEEMITTKNAATAIQPEGRRLDFPDHRPFFRVLDMEGGPLLAGHGLGRAAKVFDVARRIAWLFAGVVEPTL